MTPPAKQADVYINGRFLTQYMGGVQRFSREVVKALDKLIFASEAESRRRWILLVPRGVNVDLALTKIITKELPPIKGHVWDQLIRFFVPSESILVGLANSGPVLRRRSLVVIHDAAVYKTPVNFTRRYRLFHQMLGRVIARRSVIATVSEFSRRELAESLTIAVKDIFVAPNGCDQVSRIVPDESVFSTLQLPQKKFFLFVGSPSPNKNLGAAIKAFEALQASDYKFVIVGAANESVFGDGLSTVPPGIVLTGKIPDAQVKALMMKASALIFPSLYEGFGIPPIEAMMCGCPVVAAKIPAVTEVCGDAAMYFDPANLESIIFALKKAIAEPALLQSITETGLERAKSYTWQKSAICLLTAINSIT